MNSNSFIVEKLVHGGDGIVRDGGRVIFVPLVIPGERIEVRLDSGKGRTLRGRAVRILEPSPDRVEPRCPLFGRCGGCRFQHMTYAAELAIKRGIVEECFSRIGGFSVEVPAMIASPREYGYRSRVRLRIGSGRLGYFEEGSREFVPLEDCLLARSEINASLPSLMSLSRRERWGEVEIMADDEGTVMAVAEEKRGRRSFVRAGENWIAAPGRMTAFTQVNPEQNLILCGLVGSLMAESRPERALELFAGSGNLTEVVLAHAGEVTASDLDEQAIELARQRWGAAGRLRLHALSAEVMVQKAIADGLCPDLVLLDPPRTGAREVMPGIAALGPRWVVYVSCDPATLARDLKALCGRGYGLRRLHALDMFPRTAHLETVVLMER